MTEIRVSAEEGPIALRFDDLVRYHGHSALAMLAVTFRAQEVAFARLCGSSPPARAAIAVRSGHPGPGVRDAFEMVTRCVTRGAYTLDSSLAGPRLNPRSETVYAFEVTVSDHGTLHVAVRTDVLPEAFFVHLNAPADQKSPSEFAALRREIAESVLAAQDPEALFECSLRSTPDAQSDTDLRRDPARASHPVWSRNGPWPVSALIDPAGQITKQIRGKGAHRTEAWHRDRQE